MARIETMITSTLMLSCVRVILNPANPFDLEY